MLKIGCSYHHLILIFLLLYSELLSGQVTFVIDEIPDNTSPEDSIFISGNFEGWTGGQNNFRFIPGEGKSVLVRHGEYLSVYSYMSEVFVKAGDKITTKQDLGLLVSENNNSKTDIHFELWKGMSTLNPAYWLFVK